MLKVRNLTARYGTSQVLFGMDFEAARGECITLIGRNGMGKSTTVRSLLGMLRTHEGTVEFDGAAIGDWPSYRIAQAGIGLVPEGDSSALTTRQQHLVQAIVERQR